VPEVQLADLVCVRSRFVRSVALVRDWELPDAVEGYLLTPAGLDVLGRLAASLRGNSATRSWSVTGPYGSGKSAFALFAAHAFCGGPAAGPARAAIKQHAPAIAKGLFQSTGPLAKSSLCPVLLTGSREPLEAALAAALARSLKARGIRPPKGLAEFTAEGADRTTRLVTLYEEALGLVWRNGDAGLLLVVDEFGKYLEYAATRTDDGDVFALQSLSELAARSGTPFLIVTILHQAVERYSANVSVARRQEWGKIQGRFEEVAFEEPTEQVLRLLAKALEPTGTSDARKTLDRHIREVAGEAWGLGFRTGTLDRKEFGEVLAACAPLHPTTALLLGPLFKRLAQNERSLFAFLSSGEPFGFQDFITREKWGKSGRTFRLDRLYDYVTAALGSALYSQHRGKHWAEVQSALDRLRDAPALEVRVAKAVGLVQAVGYSAGVPASKDFLRFAFAGEAAEKEIDEAIAALDRRSVIVYRRHADSYALWEGSDVNIEGRIEEARRAVDPSRQLTSYLVDLAPPVSHAARKHSHRTGTLRYFEASYANAGTLPDILARPFGSADGRVVYCLPVSPEDRVAIEQRLKAGTPPGVLVALPGDIGELKEACVELACLHWVGQHTPELAGDGTARRELRARLATAEHALGMQIRRLFLPSAGGRCHWFYQGGERSFATPRHLNGFLSDVCDRVYSSTPTWQNELINRRALSSSATAARRDLIEAMIAHTAEEALGIQGTPPERSMYESILAAPGLHRKDKESGEWGFQPPKRKTDPALADVWRAIDRFLTETETHPGRVADLFAMLRTAPFGLKDGVLPVLLAAVLLHYDTEVALYSEGTFVPTLHVTLFEQLMRDAAGFEVQRCRIVGPRAEVFSKYAAMLSSAMGQRMAEEPTLLQVVRPLLKFKKGLTDYVGKTEKLGNAAKAVYAVFSETRQPDQLLFKDLPVACGAEPFGSKGVAGAAADAFFGTLRGALVELQQAYPRLQAEVGHVLVGAFKLTSPVAQARPELTHKAKLVSDLAVDAKLKSFICRALDTASDDQQWVESLASLLANKPTRSWNDEDRAKFEVNLALTARTFQHFHALAFDAEQGGAPILDGDATALRVAVTLPNRTDVERVVRIPARLADRAGLLRADIRRALADAGMDDQPEVGAAVLAQVVRDLLAEDGPEQAGNKEGI
jgi:hypothetical protein